MISILYRLILDENNHMKGFEHAGTHEDTSKLNSTDIDPLQARQVQHT